MASDKDGDQFLPLAHASADVFRFVCLVPRGAAQVEYTLHLRHASERFGIALRDVGVRPIRSRTLVETTRADAAADPAWRAERDLRSAIARRAHSLLASASPLRAEHSPFSEAVIEHFILDTHDVGLADRLAERRLAAGRDREALVLLGVSDLPALRRAATRRDLLALATEIAQPTSGRRIGAGRLLLSAGATGGSLDAMTAAGWSVETCDLGATAKTTDRPTDTDPVAVRALADRMVSQGRGRDPGLVWADRLDDALAGADAATRLCVPLVYDATDIAMAMEERADAAWVETDVGRLEQALEDAAIGAADVLISRSEAVTAWLTARGVASDRILLATDDGVASRLEAMLSEAEVARAPRRRARTPT